jgi:hypothetical protein
MPISDDLRALSARLVDGEPTDFLPNLSEAIQNLVAQSYVGASTVMFDAANVSEPIDIAIRLNTGAAVRNDGAFHSDFVAAAIVVIADLTLDTLRDAYRRVASAKSLEKTATAGVHPAGNNSTIGAIIAKSASISLDAIADALEAMHRQTPHDHWVDLVTIVGVGTINHAVQFPGEGVAGDHLPPSRGLGQNRSPPWYVIVVINPDPTNALNKALSILMAHLSVFKADAGLPNFLELVEGMFRTVITRGGFQFDVSGLLKPVPRDQYADRLLPTQPLRIEGDRGQLLGTIKRMPWQDGAVVLLKGRALPLQGLFVFFDRNAITNGMTLTRPGDVQLSCVLPLSQEQFAEGLTRFQRQSNMKVQPPRERMIVQRISEEGTATPYVGRLLLGMLRLRDYAFIDQAGKDTFDRHFEQISSALGSAREAAKHIREIWQTHTTELADGSIVERSGSAFHIAKTIDGDLRRSIETLLNAGIRALKHGLQQLVKELGTDIGFWFQKLPQFERKLEDLRQADPALAAYLAEARNSWCETFVLRRNAVEHDGWSLPRVEYRPNGTVVVALEPTIDNMPMREFAETMLDRSLCAVEDVLAHLVAKRIGPMLALHEVAPADRTDELPERFSITMAVGGEPSWVLAYQTTRFDQH